MTDSIQTSTLHDTESTVSQHESDSFEVVLHLPQSNTNLLDLPSEVLHHIFSFLATDSLVNISLTCQTCLRIVGQLKTWSHHHFRVESAYHSSHEFEAAIKRAMTLPTWTLFAGDTTAFANTVTSITLDMSRNGHFPIDTGLIFLIMEIFIAIREARFVGCLSSGREFVGTALGSILPNPVDRWMARGNLTLLDLSDGERLVRKRGAGPIRGSSDPLPPNLAWGSGAATFSDDLAFFETLFRFHAIEYYPTVCTRCRREPCYSWCADGLCLLCSLRGACLQCQCGPEIDSRSFCVRCDLQCRWQTQSCEPCRLSAGWTPCSVPNCRSERCPICPAPALGVCDACGGTSSYFCSAHEPQCSCEVLCVECFKEDLCTECGRKSGCSGCKLGRLQCDGCGVATCRTCLQICTEDVASTCFGELCSRCIFSHDCTVVLGRTVGNPKRGINIS
ncbi:hypothetical protein M427DRAFT_56334 [Gonapodya prolifera JEL478]|uniref:F-box domain-containing protein n=1 Tax=Gonapodya prolifera (strain JEL478) TaxID=1344416 RepID=A0A139AH30_GONPJ|nr:hypothetical protein M427DRAFT_56334 [Gonapodya prolifera JEL478]|eukprot:KXS16048.1 hypothetical protein M427DRAFT_56334 [Gonapodya prolifera JEL478]